MLFLAMAISAIAIAFFPNIAVAHHALVSQLAMSAEDSPAAESSYLCEELESEGKPIVVAECSGDYPLLFRQSASIVQGLIDRTDMRPIDMMKSECVRLGGQVPEPYLWIVHITKAGQAAEDAETQRKCTGASGIHAAGDQLILG
ncbi:hypothetical protein C4569_01725 [Candidatus Parcubacteria bacterium]|nr:MAG: hypothetical protein C4569_01725 [Candidatus Parcubacteria bacterium]